MSRYFLVEKSVDVLSSQTKAKVISILKIETLQTVQNTILVGVISQDLLQQMTLLAQRTYPIDQDAASAFMLQHPTNNLQLLTIWTRMKRMTTQSNRFLRRAKILKKSSV